MNGKTWRLIKRYSAVTGQDPEKGKEAWKRMNRAARTQSARVMREVLDKFEAAASRDQKDAIREIIKRRAW